MKASFYSQDLDSWNSLLEKRGEKSFASSQVFQWLYKKNEPSPLNWSNLSKDLRKYLDESFERWIPKIIFQQKSTDGTTKFLLGLKDKQSIEMVVIPSERRITVCVSSQVGCAIGCSFCHTATTGLKRHLDCSEIIGQLIVAREYAQSEWKRTISNVVFMGQGEPLHNFNAVKSAINIMTSPQAFGMGGRKITLSTSGLVPQIERLHEFPSVNIAISLHSARDHVRTQLMPINRVYDLERLSAAIKKIPLKAHRYITYEYLLIDGINNLPEDLDALAEFIDRKSAKINLIPYNSYPGGPYKRPDVENVKWFMNGLITRGYVCTVRQTRGEDILAACGQLKTEFARGKSPR